MLEASFEKLPNACRLRVARLGKGRPIVFLHGYPDNLQIWCDLARGLSRSFESIAFDWPGMGYSDPWKGGTTPWHQAERLLSLFDLWKLDRAVLVGADMGGQPALVFAADHPERVSHLVVMNCLAFPEEKTSWEIRVLRKFGWNRTILRRLPGTVFRRAERSFLPRGINLSPELREDMWEGFRRKEVREFIIRMCAGYQGSLQRLPDLYPKICRPTLVLWAEQDKHFPPVHAQRLHAAVSRSRLEIVAGAEHWMAWYLADQVAEIIRAFIGH